MSATTTPIPASSSSFTRALWPSDPAPMHRPASLFGLGSTASFAGSEEALKAEREDADLRTVRRMVAECAAMVDNALPRRKDVST
jgi:hypothetical protein